MGTFWGRGYILRNWGYIESLRIFKRFEDILSLWGFFADLEIFKAWVYWDILRWWNIWNKWNIYLFYFNYWKLFIISLKIPLHSLIIALQCNFLTISPTFRLKGPTVVEAVDEKIGYKSNETRRKIWFCSQFDKSKAFWFNGVQGWWQEEPAKNVLC